jgi:hypothetical protein
VSSSAFTLNFLLAGTVNDLPGPKSAHFALSGSNAESLPVMTVIISTVDVPNSYSPGAMTPTVAGHWLVSKAMDFTLPLKYSFVLNICVSVVLISSGYVLSGRSLNVE